MNKKAQCGWLGFWIIIGLIVLSITAYNISKEKTIKTDYQKCIEICGDSYYVIGSNLKSCLDSCKEIIKCNEINVTR